MPILERFIWSHQRITLLGKKGNVAENLPSFWCYHCICVLINNKCSCNWSSSWSSVCSVQSSGCLCRLNISFKIYPYILSTTKCTLNFKPLFLRLLFDLLVLLDNCNIFFTGLHDLDAPPAPSTVHLPIQVQFFLDPSITRYNTICFIQFVCGM